MSLRSSVRTVMTTLVLFTMASSGSVSILSSAQHPNASVDTSSEVMLEDFNDIVTATDMGINDFSGNMGAINEAYVRRMGLQCSDTFSCALQFEWDFGNDLESFTGIFLSLFGLTDTVVTFDGSVTETVSFPEHFLILDRIDGVFNEPGGPRTIQKVCVELSYQGTQDLKLRTELKDVQGGIRFTRLSIVPSPALQKLCWDFRDPNSYRVPIGSSDLNLQKAKLLTFVIERQNVADGVQNPQQGTVSIYRTFFTIDKSETQPVSDQELLDLLERRTYQFFLDWSSRKPNSLDIPQDRSAFGDLLTVGGIGFGLPAHIIAAERGWISRTEAITRTLNVLRILDTSAAFGPEPVGRTGYKGWFYHFLGVDGRRKLNFDFPETARNEALNTVELSTIDTGLALMGVLAAQSYFSGDDSQEKEIRERAQAIYDRVDWSFMLEPASKQFYLGWKPNEAREASPPFDIPDTEGKGSFSGTPGDPATLDFYTDEALIVILLAVGSTTHPVPADVYYALKWDRDPQGLIRTWPGALFTYQFLHAFLDTRSFLPSCPSKNPANWNWFMNSRQAILAAIQYAENNPRGFLAYGSDAWGISAAEGPFDEYHAYGALPLAISPQPEEDGTVTYYATLSAISFGDDLRQRALSALRSAWARGHWHPRFGLPDAFNDNIGQSNPPTGTVILRTSGPWIQRPTFAIDQGPMLLHLENARSGLIWNLIAQNPNIQRALNRLKPLVPARIMLEGEMGSGDGQIMARSNASGQQTVWLHAGESRALSFTSMVTSPYTLSVRYSNDNYGPFETMSVSIDEASIGQFEAQDTGDYGFGWNVFVWSNPISKVNVLPGAHTITISVSGGDGWGVELDAVALDFYTYIYCINLPLVMKYYP